MQYALCNDVNHCPLPLPYPRTLSYLYSLKIKDISNAA